MLLEERCYFLKYERLCPLLSKYSLLSLVNHLLWSDSQVHNLTPFLRGRGKGREKMVPVYRRDKVRGKKSKGEYCVPPILQLHSHSLILSLTSFPNPGPHLLPHSCPPPGSPSPPSVKTSSRGWAGRAHWRPYRCTGEAHVDGNMTRLFVGTCLQCVVT